MVSNGNSYADRIGLGGCFDAEFYGPQVGFRKPDPRMFRHVTSSLGLDPASCLMVGDSIEHDVDAAIAAGWRAVHLDRLGVGRAAADAVRTLADLLDWLD